MPERHGYWYVDDLDVEDSGAPRRRAIELLQAFRFYRAAEVAMRRRTRDSMAMGENDLLLLRYLLKARNEDRLVSPGELAKYLSVTTASMTAMIDRLERSGHVRRQPHATDRRSIWIIPTEDADEEVRRTLGTMHERMLDAVIDLTPEENRVVVATLARLQSAIDHIEPEQV